MKRSIGFLFGCALFAPLSLASSANALNFVVTRTDDPAPGACDSGVDCSLREAVIAANASNATDDVIELGANTYNLTIAEDGSATGGSLDISDDLRIQGQGAEATIVNGVQPGLGSRILEVDGSGLVVTLDGLTVQGGDSNGGAGGGILAASTSHTLTLSNCRVTGNFGGNGGGMFSNAITLLQNCRFDHNIVEAGGDAGAGVFFGSSAGLTVENSIFDNNEVLVQGTGAGLFFEGGAFLEISGSRFEANKLSDNGEGAGLHCAGNDPVTIAETVFAENSIVGGSGAGAAISCSPSSLLLDGVTVAFNTTDGGDYAGIFISGSGLTSIRNSLIEGNRITASTGRYPAGLLTTDVEILDSTVRDNVNEGNGDGGGLWVTGDLLVSGSTFSGNRTNGKAGALTLESAAIDVTNSSFANNSAGGDGGALWISTGEGSFNNVTVARNTSEGSGGGVLFQSFTGFSLHNSILAGNEAGFGPECSSNSPIFSEGYNLLGTAAGCPLTPAEGDPASTDLYEVDPLLAELADNGGPTETLALLSGSPAIDGGDPAGCTDENGDPLTVDQRGAPRPHGDRCDIGAFEFGSLPPDLSELTITKSVDDAEVFQGQEVTFTITVSNSGASNTQVVVSDDLPLGLALLSATGEGADCTISGNALSCVAASLADGAGFSVTVIATAEDVGTWENTATVAGQVRELDPTNNSASVTVSVEAGGSLGGGGCDCWIGAQAPTGTWMSLAWLMALAGALALRGRRG